MAKKELVEIRSVTLKARRAKSDYILLNINYSYPFLFEPKFEKLIVSVNGKDTEIKI